MKRILGQSALLVAVALSAVSCMNSLNEFDLNRPVGWAACASSGAEPYDLCGGGEGARVVLKAEGEGDAERIRVSLDNFDVVILDGSAGEFIFDRTVVIDSLSGKTLVGINGAVLRSRFMITDQIRTLLHDTDNLPTNVGSGNVLSNGIAVGERREYVQRQILLDAFGDLTEAYRFSGIFTLRQCENFIVRNISFVGPGSIDVGGDPLVRLSACNHVWIDHCSFTDGIKCNLVIDYSTDFADVTWTTFRYSPIVINHNYCVLMGGSDNNPIRDRLHVTFANDIWGENIDARIPMARFGSVHILNNLYSCVGTKGINPRKDSKFLIEGCYFMAGVKPFCTYGHAFSAPEAYNWKDCIFEDEFIPEDLGEVRMPYRYVTIPTEKVPEVLQSANGAGPTLRNPLKVERIL